MTIQITGDDDRNDLARKVGATVDRAQLRTSGSRERRLERASQRRTRVWDLQLEIDPNVPTAHCDQNGDTPTIRVGGKEFEQPVTDLGPVEWDFFAQRALAWHEDGHVLFTDHDHFMSCLNGIANGDKGTAKQFWNALEDGAIEKQLAGRWSNAYDVLRVFRANMFLDQDPGIHDMEEGGQVFPLAHAVQAVLLDDWMSEVYGYDRDIRSKLVDPDDHEYHFGHADDREIFIDDILPLIDDIVPTVLSTPDAQYRNGEIFTFIKAVLDLLDDSAADGKAMMNRDSGETEDGMPDDASDGHSGEAREDADQLDGGAAVPSDSDESSDPTDVEIDPEMEAEAQEKAAGDRRSEAGLSDDLLDELEEMSDIAAGGEIQSSSIEYPNDNWTVNEATFEAAKRGSRSLARILKSRLQRERASETKRHQDRGRFTGRGGAAQRARRGERKVKEQVTDPDEKDYHFVFLLDRSTSMSGGKIRKAEEALGSLAMALEEVGVDVMIVELYSSRARLAKPFAKDVEQAKAEIFSGQVSGGTPLTPALEMSRERLKMEGENSYMVVVTDGAPAAPGQFTNEINLSTMPVLGVNITDEPKPTGMSEYDRAVAVSPTGDLQQALADYIREVMF